MSETYAGRGYAGGGYADDDPERTALGGVILVTLSLLATILVLAGLVYALGTDARHKAAVLAADCEPTLYLMRLPCITQQMLISQYEATVNPAVKQLTADTAAYRTNEARHLVAAEAALTAEVETEQALDSSLAAMAFTPQNRARAVALITNASSTGNQTPPAASITFTPRMTVVASALIQANQALAKLTVEQARSTSLTEMRSFNVKAEAAGTAVLTEMKLLRAAVHAPLAAS
jgi:hypothetical protein